MGRITNSIRNMKFAVAGQLISTLMGFISRKVFIVFLSAEYLGLNGLFSNILSMLSLVEMGLGSAIVFSLYKPIAQNDIEEIKSLMLLYKMAYWVMGLFVLFIGCSLAPFLEVLIKGMPNIPNIRLYYLMYVVNTGFSYFYSYKTSLIIANQNQYLTTLYDTGFNILLKFSQIAALFLTGSFALYLALNIAATLLTNIAISWRANKLFPYLREKEVSPLSKETLKTIKKNILALVFYKSGFIFINGTTNILLARLVGLVEVGLYSNYFLITSTLKGLINLLFQSVTASIGNLNAVAEDVKKQEVFRILNFAGAWLNGFCAVCLWTLLNPFIELWLGMEYLFAPAVVFWIVLNFYMNGMRMPVITPRNAMGLYWQGRYKPLFEAVINLIVSIILGLKLGLSGIFIGAFIGHVTTFWVEPLVLYKYGLHAPVRDYFIRYGIHATVTLVAVILTDFLCGLVHFPGIPGFLMQLIICAVIPNILFLLAYYRSEEFHYILKLIFKIIKRQV